MAFAIQYPIQSPPPKPGTSDFREQNNEINDIMIPSPWALAFCCWRRPKQKKCPPRSSQWTVKRPPRFLSSHPHHRAHNGFLATNPHGRRRRASRGQLDCPGPVLLLPRRLVSNRLCVCALHRRLGVKLLHPQRRRCLFSIRRLLLQEGKLSIPRRLHRQVVEFVQMPKVLLEP